jgi:hypothetical protein
LPPFASRLDDHVLRHGATLTHEPIEEIDSVMAKAGHLYKHIINGAELSCNRWHCIPVAPTCHSGNMFRGKTGCFNTQKNPCFTAQKISESSKHFDIDLAGLRLTSRRRRAHRLPRHFCFSGDASTTLVVLPLFHRTPKQFGFWP